MSPRDWHTLRDWLYRVFPAHEATELFANHVREAAELKLPLPPHGPEVVR